MNNFVLHVDSQGKMPIMTKIGVPLAPSVAKHHKYWVEYRNDRPVKARPFPQQHNVWDYGLHQFVELEGSSIKIVE